MKKLFREVRKKKKENYFGRCAKKREKTISGGAQRNERKPFREVRKEKRERESKSSAKFAAIRASLLLPKTASSTAHAGKIQRHIKSHRSGGQLHAVLGGGLANLNNPLPHGEAGGHWRRGKREKTISGGAQRNERKPFREVRKEKRERESKSSAKFAAIRASLLLPKTASSTAHAGKIQRHIKSHRSGGQLHAVLGGGLANLNNPLPHSEAGSHWRRGFKLHGLCLACPLDPDSDLSHRGQGPVQRHEHDVADGEGRQRQRRRRHFLLRLLCELYVDIGAPPESIRCRQSADTVRSVSDAERGVLPVARGQFEPPSMDARPDPALAHDGATVLAPGGPLAVVPDRKPSAGQISCLQVIEA
eukprot:CAMPEP_0196666916 /NCGR_PEP_ID=MMETSP1086-20130531/64788_1 /TAXON_ID=77921 /ORGANISM="Cyanoptyche  gloeocystis , Strain SAG4.97" /LENGTH=360 /DNA_ID=CAMNT_0042004179 /DNA_START=1199 /DNA_END=2281 /DNA_ORIENTATION=-